MTRKNFLASLAGDVSLGGNYLHRLGFGPCAYGEGIWVRQRIAGGVSGSSPSVELDVNFMTRRIPTATRK